MKTFHASERIPMLKILYCDYQYLKGLLCVWSLVISVLVICYFLAIRGSLAELVVGWILDTMWQGHGIYFVTSANLLQLYKWLAPSLLTENFTCQYSQIGYVNPFLNMPAPPEFVIPVQNICVIQNDWMNNQLLTQPHGTESSGRHKNCDKISAVIKKKVE
jgi:hypothetical protein